MLSERQVDLHDRAAATPAPQTDPAAVLVDDLLAHGEAEAGAARLRGEERIEGAAAHGGRHAGALVADGDRDVAVAAADLAAHLAAGRRRIDGVREHVPQ